MRIDIGVLRLALLVTLATAGCGGAMSETITDARPSDEALDRAANEALVQRFVEVVNAHDKAGLAEVIAVDYIQHNPLVPQGLVGLQQAMDMFLAAFPDFRIEVEAVAVDGDVVVARMRAYGTHRGEFLGVPATNKQVSWSTMDWWRVDHDKLAEHWDQIDLAGLMQQLTSDS